MKTDTQGEDGHVKVEAETRVTLPQAKEHLGHQKLRRSKGGFFLCRFQREHGPEDTLILDL